MRKTTFPLEEALGMRYYASDAPGIGGRLRTTPEDFIVDEIPGDVGDEGPYLICRLTKKEWDLQRAVKELAKRLGISHRRIGWGGTKDKHAITTQLISLYSVSPEEIGQVHMKDLSIEVVGRSKEALSLGAHLGNRFDIVIRDADPEDLGGRVNAVTACIGEGVPNYYGLQRFGVIRPLTHIVGGQILRGDYEAAVLTYVGQACPLEPEGVQEVRRAFAGDRDAVAAIRHLPAQMSYERALLHHLSANPGDYAGALQNLPPRLLSLFVSAFQSYIFNMALSLRLEDGGSLTAPEPGDRLLFPNGREDRVTAVNQGAAAIHASRGRCQIAIFIPGGAAYTREGDTDRYIAGLMDEFAINGDRFREAAAFVHTRFEGALRPIALRTAVEADVTGDHVSLRFSLPPGHYATTVCREYMKADPVMMI
jgi:tRNA pseudouridine13 synthase